MTLEEQIRDLQPTNSTDYIIQPFNDFFSDCEVLFDEEEFIFNFGSLIESYTKEDCIRILIDNYHFGDIVRIFGEEDNEEYVIQWLFD